jgi:hypothetical protein
VLYSVTAAVYSQSLMHAVGANISVLYGKVHTPYSSSSFSMELTNLSYFPRYNFVENENSSVSVGMPLGVGFGLVSNNYGDDAGIVFSYDIPLVLDYNIGCKSTPGNENGFGGYFGAGFGYQQVIISKSSYSDFNGSSFGPLARAGMRFSRNEDWHGLGITVGLFFKKGLEKDKFNTTGFNVLIDL